MHACIHTYIHACMHAYIHIYIYIYTCWFYPWAMGTSQVSLGFPPWHGPMVSSNLPKSWRQRQDHRLPGAHLGHTGQTWEGLCSLFDRGPFTRAGAAWLAHDDDDDDDHDHDHDDHVGFMNPWHPWSILSVGRCCMCSSEDVSSMLCSIVSDRLRTHRRFADSEDIRRYCRLMQVSCDYRCP